MLTYGLFCMIREILGDEYYYNWDTFLDFCGSLFGIVILTLAFVITIPLNLILIPFYLIGFMVYIVVKKIRKHRDKI